jgi:FlaA1/EpsC-like NDP-sugar epimerase
MSGRKTRWRLVAIDLLVLSAALWIAALMRFDGLPPPPMLERLLLAWPSIVLLHYAALSVVGVPRFAWRYVGLLEVSRILAALAAGTALLLLARLAAGELLAHLPAAEHLMIPIGVLLIHLCLAFLGIAGVRALRRLSILSRTSRTSSAAHRPPKKVLLVGAGEAGRAVAHELSQHPELGRSAVGFVDDDPFKRGLTIRGLRVLGTTASLPELIRETGADEVLISIARAAGRDIRRISELCRELGVQVSIVPGLAEIVRGTVNLSTIREVSVEDLLRREPVELEEGTIREDLAGRVVLVSGAGGSIGSELCRQICRYHPASLILLERCEYALFEIHRELVEHFTHLSVIPAIGDVCDAARVDEIFAQRKPEVVYHAAAHKHVPMMEENPAEAIKNNVGGTQMLADAAHRHRAAVFTMISTDKAVNPTSVMGASKRVAELYVQALAGRSETRFVTVRFGNVLGSAGSVIPIFRKQLARGGPLTVTHPEMRRYFMTIPEACQLVLQASAMGAGGEIFILDMGEPVRIADLARDMIRLSGLEPEEDIDIEYSGVRPGEKLYEELYVSGKHPARTRHPRIFTGRGRARDLGEVSAAIAQLLTRSRGAEAETIRRALAAIVPEYRPPAHQPPEKLDLAALQASAPAGDVAAALKHP